MVPGNENKRLYKTVTARPNRVLIIVILLLLAVIVWLLLKPPVPSPPIGPPIHDVRKHHGPGKEKTASGTVQSYKYNAHFDINAIVIKTINAGMLTIDFKPHTAKAVTSVGAVGNQVTVRFSLHPDDEAVGYQLNDIKNNKTGKVQILEELPPPPDIPDHSTENFKLINPVLITDQYGGIVALRKDNLLFHFKPGLVDDVAPLIKECRAFNLTAVRRDDDLGFVNVNHDKVYIVITITMDNKTFLVR